MPQPPNDIAGLSILAMRNDLESVASIEQAFLQARRAKGQRTGLARWYSVS